MITILMRLELRFRRWQLARAVRAAALAVPADRLRAALWVKVCRDSVADLEFVLGQKERQ